MDPTRKPLRICHLGKFYPPATGGVETHVRTLAQAQAALGADVRVLCVNHADARGRDVTWSATAITPTVREADGRVGVTRSGRILSIKRFDVCPSLPALLVRDLFAHRFDVVHVHAPNPTMFAALAAIPLPGALVVTHHSDIVAQQRLRIAFAPLERFLLDRATLVFSDSDDYVGGSPALLRIREKVRTLPLGIDLRPFLSPSERARAHAVELRSRHPGPLFLCVGRLVYYKGLTTAIDALAHCDGTLMIVGEGPLEGELRAHAERRGVAARVVFAGRLDADELVGALHAATAFWFPSNARSEAYGLAQVEALASGCPVVNTRVPFSGVSWVSLDGVSGLTVDVGDAAALGAAARRLADDAGLRAKLSCGARERARGEFDARVMAERSLELYREALERRAEQSPWPWPAGVAHSVGG